MQDLWIIIGRFQPFHKGHKLLVDTAINECKSILLLIGSSEGFGGTNPYSYELRKKIIENEISDEKIFIWALPDFKSDEEWVKYILSYIPKIVDSCTIYCWDKNNDSAIKTLQQYKNLLYFDHEIKEIPRSIIPISATEVRKALQSWDKEYLEDFLLESTIEKYYDDLLFTL